MSHTATKRAPQTASEGPFYSGADGRARTDGLLFTNWRPLLPRPPTASRVLLWPPGSLPWPGVESRSRSPALGDTVGYTRIVGSLPPSHSGVGFSSPARDGRWPAKSTARWAGSSPRTAAQKSAAPPSDGFRCFLVRRPLEPLRPSPACGGAEPGYAAGHALIALERAPTATCRGRPSVCTARGREARKTTAPVWRSRIAAARIPGGYGAWCGPGVS
jgi:hypothetical protein